MNWINDTFGTELSSNVQLGIMFGALLLALLILLWLFRRIFGSAQSRIARNRQPRLGVIEAAIVDDTRRLVLVRRDNTEHLLMIGGPGDVVIETGIGQTDPARKDAPAAPVTQAATGPAAPETTPREPRLIEPLNDDAQQAAIPHQARAEATPAGQAATAAATGAAAAAVTVAASKAAEAVEEVKSPVEEPALEMPQSEAPQSETEGGEMQGSEALSASEASPDSAEEITGEIAEELDTPAAETQNLASNDEDAEEDTATDTEEDMQKLLDELAGSKK